MEKANASTQIPVPQSGLSLGSTRKYILDKKILWSHPQMPKTPPHYVVTDEDRETNRDRAMRLYKLLHMKRKEDPAGRYFVSGSDVVKVTIAERADAEHDDLSKPDPDFWYGHVDTEWFDEELDDSALLEVNIKF